MERSDRMWSAGEGNGKPLQYSCLENPMNSMKRQNDRRLKEELPGSVGAYLYPSEGRQKENRNHRKLTKLITWITALFNSMNDEPYHVGSPKMDGSWWRVLTKHGPLEQGMVNHFSMLALST